MVTWVLKRASGVLAIGVFAGAFGLYFATLAPGILGGDAGELQFVPAILSLAHPSGYPLQTLLDSLWIALVPWGSVAWRTNLLSAVVAAGGVTGIFVLTLQTCGAGSKGRLAGLVAAVCLAVSPVYWSQAVLADKYALNGFISVIGLIAAWRFYRQSGARQLFWLAAASGLGLAHHRSLAVFGPPVALLVVMRGWQLWRRRVAWAAGAGGLVLPMALYLYLFWASARGLPPGYLEGLTAHEFVDYVFVAGSAGQVQLRLQMDGLVSYGSHFLANFGLAAAVAVATGVLIQGWLRPGVRSWAVFLAAAFFCSGYLAANYENYDLPRRYVYFIPSYVCFAALIGHGVAGWWDGGRLASDRLGRRGPMGAVLGLAMVAVIAVPLLTRAPETWRARWFDQRTSAPLDIWRQVLKGGGQADRLAAGLALARPGALIVADWEQATPLWYAQQVDGICPDCRIVQGLHHMVDFAAQAAQEGRPLYVARTLHAAADWRYPTAAGPLVHLAAEPEYDVPEGMVQLGLRFDDAVELSGYLWPLGEPQPVAGRVLPISLIWRSVVDNPTAYAVSLRLLGTGGEVWKADSPAPVLGMARFDGLTRGQVVADYYEIPLDYGLAPGEYNLTVLLYHVPDEGGFRNAVVSKRPATLSTGRDVDRQRADRDEDGLLPYGHLPGQADAQSNIELAGVDPVSVGTVLAFRIGDDGDSR